MSSGEADTLIGGSMDGDGVVDGSRSGPPRGLSGMMRVVGPGLVVAATGVGAGDLVAAAKAGSTLGFAVLWAVLAGAVLKLVLAEGVARWQLATGTTLVEGWFTVLGWPVRLYFMVFLSVWTVVVAAALMSACGMAAYALVPALSVRTWAVIHAALAAILVWMEGYPVFERVMGAAVALMVITLVSSAAPRVPAIGTFARGLLVPVVPQGGTLLVAGVIGGVGGTVTLLAYGYWLREKGWEGKGWIRVARVDLGVGYFLTAVFGLAVVVLAGAVLKPGGVVVAGSEGVVRLAGMLGEGVAPTWRAVFLIGFWAAVASSIVGVWQGVPYLFAHAAELLGLSHNDDRPIARRPVYRGALLAMTFPPMVLLLLDRPVWLIVVYAALGSLFMPFLAATLLILNNRRDLVGDARNRLAANAGLVACLVLFAYLGSVELLRLLR